MGGREVGTGPTDEEGQQLPARCCSWAGPHPQLEGGQRGLAGGCGPRRQDRTHRLAVVVSTGCYGGYFGAGAGITMLALISLRDDEPLPVTNAVKNVVTGAANLVATVAFAPIDYTAAGTMSVGALVGSWWGPWVVRVLPERPCGTPSAWPGWRSRRTCCDARTELAGSYPPAAVRRGTQCLAVRLEGEMAMTRSDDTSARRTGPLCDEVPTMMPGGRREVPLTRSAP
jgi:hypothetical protein